MTPSELKSARLALGFSAQRFARFLRIKDGRTVRYWEAGENDIPGPVVVLLELVMSSKDARRHLGLPEDL